MKKLKQLWQWIDDRSGISEMINPLAKHPVPSGAKWAYVFGSATLFCLILQVVTGIALAFLYQPSSETAYESLKYINDVAPLGHILRGIHYWGASAMILLVGIHMIRVYITAAFKYPREMSWISGLILLLLTVLMGFTGQLLRWDSNGVWSAIVGAQQAGRVPLIGTWAAHFLIGGDTIGGASLNRFFAIHVFLVPAILFGLLGLHLYLVIRNGISEPPKAGRPVDPKTYRKWYENMLHREGVPFFPNAAWRDMAFGLLVVLAVIALAVIYGAPEIGTPPNPSDIHSNPRPDWYLLWIFALFALMPPQIESIVMAFGPPLVGLILILLPIFANKGERSPLRRPWAIGIVIFIVMTVAVFWYEGTKSPWSPDFQAKPLSKKVVGEVSQEAMEGSQLFFDKGCLYCHTISGHGGKRGPELTHVGARLNNEQLTLKIVNGGGNMPAYGSSLNEKELRALISFLKTRN
ncbi:MAG TPA: cytochrome b N-terminal domain-containing protein [Bacteroidales bacterium]|nr:cytochrome b N-terminal domain-containing protein [Bacteroidales bacterium]